jgi:RNA polymerase sigma-70 factor (ECF subfamily)
MMRSKLVTTCPLLIVAGLAAWGASIGLAAPESTDPQSAPAARSRTTKAREDRPGTEVDLKLLADLPAVVLSVEPKLGATGVDPALREIRVTFSKPMTDKSWSWTGGGDTYPKSDGPIHYEKDRRTCVMPVKLEPGKTYVMGINSERFRNFKDVDGRPASPYLAAFRTRASR